MAKSTLKTTADVIDALDGPTAVGRRLRRSPQQVVNWKYDGLFPTWTYLPLTSALKKSGLSAPMRLWRKYEDITAS